MLLWATKETQKSTDGIKILLRRKRKSACKEMCQEQTVCVVTDYARVILTALVPRSVILRCVAGNTAFL